MKRWQGKSFDKICGNLSQICPKNVVPLTYFCLSFDRWISDCMSKQWNKIFFIFRIEASILRFQVLEILIKKSFFSIPRILFLWSPQKEEEDFFDLIESVPSLQIYREEETPDKNSKFENIIKKEVYPKILQFEKGEIVQAKYPYEFNFFRPSFEEPKNLKLVIFLQIHNEAFITNGALRALFRSYYALEVQVYATVLSQKGLESMNSHFPFVHSVLWENKGMDIGAFMWQIEEYLIGKENLNRTIVLKWHTKSNTVWQLENSRFLHNRRELMISLDAFQTHHNLGMIGSGPCLKLKSMVAIPPDMMNEKDEALTLMKANFGEHSVGDLIREIEMVAFGRTTHLKEREYVPGSIFMVRASLLSSLYSGIGSKMWGQIIDNGPKGYATESQIHAMERIFGYSVGVFGYEFSCTRGRFLTKRQWWL